MPNACNGQERRFKREEPPLTWFSRLCILSADVRMFMILRTTSFALSRGIMKLGSRD